MESEFRSDLTGFLANQESYDDFREYMRSLLSTFLPEKYLSIYMSEKVMPLQPRPKEYMKLSNLEIEPLGIGEDRQAGLGPFYVIRRAFTHEFVSSINLETLETLGDVVLNEAVVMIITTAWPNLLKEAGQVTDMKKFYTNNTSAAKYAEKLGFLRWIVRAKDQGLNSKERADVFESFVGALVMIGEFYIGEQMGLAIGRLFLNKFLAQEEWYPENPKYYETPANLWNDFSTALPGPDALKPRIIKKSMRQDLEEEGGTGLWYFALTIGDPRGQGEGGGEVKKRTGRDVIKFRAKARSKDAAKTEVYDQLARAMKLDRGEINRLREQKRAKDPALQPLLRKLEEYGKKVDKVYQVPAKQPRGGQTFVFIEEVSKEIVKGRELTITQTVASGMAANEEAALNQAITNLISGNTFRPVAGTNFTIINPDTQPITAATSASHQKPPPEKTPTAPRSFHASQGKQKSGGRRKSTGGKKTPTQEEQDTRAKTVTSNYFLK